MYREILVLHPMPDISFTEVPLGVQQSFEEVLVAIYFRSIVKLYKRDKKFWCDLLTMYD